MPDDTKWSLTEKPGVLRLHSLPAANFYTARNSLCQRPPGPESIMTVELDTSGLQPGDNAGLALLSNPYAWIGVVKTDEGTKLQMFTAGGGRGGRRGALPRPVTQRLVRRVLRITFGSASPATSTRIGPSSVGAPMASNSRRWATPFAMTFQLQTFQGVRPALFNFNTAGQPGGYADFDNYTVEEPRARGIEREIPVGKTITLTSGDDSSLLVSREDDMSLGSVHPMSPQAGMVNHRFQVVDLGKGRVALKATNRRFLSVGAGGAVMLKDLAGAVPGDAETFQWINLMRGDTILMSLVNHRYLATKPDNAGPVTATATGPTPARKDGACFKWKAVE